MAEPTESAKAVQEVAKASGQAISVVDKLGQFFARLMGESIDATCGMISDTLKFRRWKRQLRLVDKCEQLIRDRNVTDKHTPLPPSFVLQVFHHASLEDDDFLQDLWAQLLVSAIQEINDKSRRAFVHIIQQLEPIDVKVLTVMNDIVRDGKAQRSITYLGSELPQGKDKNNAIKIQDVESVINVPQNTLTIALDNLFRLRLADSWVYTKIDQRYNYLWITQLGFAFVKACVQPVED